MYEQLWAPWRLAYVAAAKDETPADAGGCFLCRYRDDPASDAGNFVVARGARTFVVLNRYPYNNGHLLIAPMAHKAEPAELDDDELLECMRWLQRLTGVYRRLMSPDGFNAGLNLGKVAGAGLPGHLHWHLVPRWNGDTNFMPALSDTRVISQSLEALYEMLRPEIEAADTSRPGTES